MHPEETSSLHNFFIIRRYFKSMKKILFMLCALCIMTTVAYAEEEQQQQKQGEQQQAQQQQQGTPFGASCPSCDTYGYCRKTLTYKQAEQNLEAYYAQKGLDVIIVKKSGRFLEADVYKEDKIVEKVILDRKTGRIRPIY